jgi:hypothetical protein
MALCFHPDTLKSGGSGTPWRLGMRKILPALVILVLALAALGQSGDEKQSLGDAARQNRNTAKKPATRVYTDEDLRGKPSPEAKPVESKKSTQSASAVENTVTPSCNVEEDDCEPTPQPAPKAEVKSDDSQPTEAQKSANKEQSAEEKAEAAKAWKSKIDAQKQAIEMLEREISVADKERRMKASTYYSDAGTRLRDERKWVEDEKKYAADMEQKKQQLAKAKDGLQRIQDDARKAGVQGIE